jgi:hypothetical protein
MKCGTVDNKNMIEKRGERREERRGERREIVVS